jgi:ABC-type uncharacterized transport system auxiliary subunit
MSYLKRIFLITMFMLLSFVSCLNLKQPANKILYYALEYNPPEFSGMPRLSHTIKIDRFTVSPLYDNMGIVYKENEYQRDAYAYHKWRVNPGDIVTDLLTRDMRDSGLFKAVLPGGGIGTGTFYILGGNVDKFYEEDVNKDWNGILSLTINLVNEKEKDPEKKIMFQKTYLRKKKCEKKNPQALAKALSQGMNEISREIIEDIYTRLKP